MPDASLLTAALFDMDGVLVDNARFHQAAWFRYAEKLGRPLTIEQYGRHINGRVAADSLPYLLGRPVTPDEVAECVREVDGLYRALYRPHLTPTPGLVPFLTSLRQVGVRCAVCTSAPPVNVDFTLDGLALRPYFDTVVDASQISRGKPDPEIYLTAARRLGVAPARCVVFEDALLGIEAGRRAGMPVVGVATTHTRPELEPTGVRLIIDDFSQLSAQPDVADPSATTLFQALFTT